MKTHFSLPSGDYSVVLSKEDLEELLSKGSICIHIGRTSCTTDRVCINKEGNGFDHLDKKEVYNDLRFNLEEPVADKESGDWPVQFLDIILERE